jgi:hypothetical protein
MGVTCHTQIGAQFFFQGLCDDVLHHGDHRGLHLEAEVALAIAWEALTIENLQVVMQGASMVKWLGMAHWDIPPSHQVRHNPGSRGCPKIFQFREIIRTLPFPCAVCSHTDDAVGYVVPCCVGFVPEEALRAP